MTVRVLVEHAGDRADALAIALRCVMDVYVRMPRDIVLVLPSADGAGATVLEDLVGQEAAAQVREAPQPFADHTMRVVTPDQLDEETLKGRLVVVQEATPEVVSRIETHVIDGLIALPAADARLDEWAERVHAEVVRAGHDEPRQE